MAWISEQDRILLRQLAKKALAEIDGAVTAAGLDGISTSEAAAARAVIHRELLAKHEARILPKFNLPQLVYMIGVVSGRIKER